MNELLWFAIGWALGALTVAMVVSLHLGLRRPRVPWDDDEPGGGWQS